MQNVKYEVRDNKLIIGIDLTNTHALAGTTKK